MVTAVHVFTRVASFGTFIDLVVLHSTTAYPLTATKRARKEKILALSFNRIEALPPTHIQPYGACSEP